MVHYFLRNLYPEGFGLDLQAQLEKENAVLKSRVSSLQSSLVQAEHANAASADTILRLQAEVASAAHLDRLARSSEFLSVRKEAASLSVRFLQILFAYACHCHTVLEHGH